jgi:hypothetical protein
MDTFREDALDLALDKFANVDAVAGADFDKSFVPLRVELGSNVLTVEGHALGPITREIRQIGGAKKRRHLGRSLAIHQTIVERLYAIYGGILDLPIGEPLQPVVLNLSFEFNCDLTQAHS